jgi:hypothetical protein
MSRERADAVKSPDAPSLSASLVRLSAPANDTLTPLMAKTAVFGGRVRPKLPDTILSVRHELARARWKERRQEPRRRRLD